MTKKLFGKQKQRKISSSFSKRTRSSMSTEHPTRIHLGLYFQPQVHALFLMCILHGLLSSITPYLRVHKTVFPKHFITEGATILALFSFLEQDGEELSDINGVVVV